MPRISDETVQRVADANDVVDVIGSYIQLRRAGTSWKGLCPFHNERTPSFTVNPSRQTFKCFGCGEGGTVFSFVMKYEHVDFPTAIRKLAARAGIVVAEESPGDEARRGDRERLLAMQRDAAAWFHGNLLRQKFAAHARDYLKGRGVNGEIAARWQLGYAPDTWDSLVGVLHSRGYRDEEILRGGLVSVKEDGRSSFYDRFRNRVIFPIRNDYGEVVAFSGRTLGDDPAKYVNSSETPIFTKGRVLFGLDKSKRAILAANEAVVCEGQLDLISAFEAGVENVTAPQGTAFTAQQARLLRRLAENVVLCFDSDGAGRKAVERSLPALLHAGVSVRVARVPAGEDPDSMIRKHGAEAFRRLIAGARDFFDTVLDEELTSDATPQRRASLARRMAEFVKIVDDPALREAVSMRVRSRLEITDLAFAALVRSAPAPNPDREADDVTEVAELELPEAARLLCRLAILSREAREWIRSRPEPAATFGSAYALVDRLVAEEASLEEPSVFAAVSAALSPAEERALAGLHLGRVPENPSALAADAWKGLLRQKLTAEVGALQARMRHPDIRPGDMESLHKQILDLQERLRHL